MKFLNGIIDRSLRQVLRPRSPAAPVSVFQLYRVGLLGELAILRWTFSHSGVARGGFEGGGVQTPSIEIVVYLLLLSN